MNVLKNMSPRISSPPNLLPTPNQYTPKMFPTWIKNKARNELEK